MRTVPKIHLRTVSKIQRTVPKTHGGADFDAVGNVRVVASLFDAVGATTSFLCRRWGVVGITYDNGNRFAVGQQHRHFFRRLASSQPDGCRHSCRRSAGACRQSAVQGEELGQQLLYCPPQAVRTVDNKVMGWAWVSIDGAFHHKDLHASLSRRLHLFRKAATQTALLGDDGVWAQLADKRRSLVGFIIHEPLLRETVRHNNGLGGLAVKDAEPAVVLQLTMRVIRPMLWMFPILLQLPDGIHPRQRQ